MRPHSHPVPRKHGKSAAFTLVELLVVIAIIAVLGALTTVGVRGMMTKAHESNCAGNMRQLGVAIQTFIADKGRYPGPQPNQPLTTWDRQLLPYIADPDYDFTKNGVAPIREGTAEGAALGSGAKILKCPGDDVKPGTGQFKRSYAICGWTINQGSGQPGGWHNGWTLADGSARQPANIGIPPMWVTEPHRAVVMTEFWGPKTGQAKNVIGTNAYSEMFGFIGQPQDPGPFDCHKGKINVLFVDGHVESLPGNLTDVEWYQKGYSPPKSPTK